MAIWRLPLQVGPQGPGSAQGEAEEVIIPGPGCATSASPARHLSSASQLIVAHLKDGFYFYIVALDAQSVLWQDKAVVEKLTAH